jgi:hypothetical protein
MIRILNKKEGMDCHEKRIFWKGFNWEIGGCIGDSDYRHAICRRTFYRL